MYELYIFGKGKLCGMYVEQNFVPLKAGELSKNRCRDLGKGRRM